MNAESLPDWITVLRFFFHHVVDLAKDPPLSSQTYITRLVTVFRVGIKAAAEARSP